MAVVGELLTLFLGNNSQLLASTAQSEAALRGYAGTASTQSGLAATAMRGVGLAATAITAATLVMGAAGVKAAADFQEQMATINTIAHLTPPELNKVGDSIRAMAVATGTPLNEMTAAFYDLLSAGVPVAKSMEVLGLSATLSIGALSTTKEAVNLLTGAINSYGLTTEQAKVATDQFALAVQDGKVTADQISATFASVAPVARQAGIGIDEISASYAFLTAQNVPAADAMTEMNRVILELLKPGKDLRDLQEKLGVNFADIAAQKGLVVALEEMRVAAQANGVPLTDLFGRIEGLKFSLATTGPNFAGYSAELTRMGEATGTAALQASERMGTFTRQSAILGASLHDLFIDLGTALLPALTSFVQSVSSAVQAATAWSHANPGLASTILIVVGGVAALTVGVWAVTAAFGALAIIFSPIGLTILAIGAAVVLLTTHWSEFTAGVNVVIGILSGPLTAAFALLRTLMVAFQVVIDGITGAFKTLADQIAAVINLAKQAVDAVANVPGVKLGADVAGNIGGALGNIGNAIPHFASGGTVPGSGPQLAVVHGGETVVPPGQGGGSVTIHTHLHVGIKEIAELVETHLYDSASAFSSGFIGHPVTE